MIADEPMHRHHALRYALSEDRRRSARLLLGPSPENASESQRAASRGGEAKANVEVRLVKEELKQAIADVLGITTLEYPRNPDGSYKRDSYGDLNDPVETVTESKCRLSGLSATEEQRAGRLASSATAKISVPLETSIYADNTVAVNGVDWNVVGVLPNSPARSAHKDVLIARSG